jgi:hypothetical protein
MYQSMDQSSQSNKKIAYICEGSCGARITQEDYDKGLTKCGDKRCNLYGKPFKKVEEPSVKESV